MVTRWLSVCGGFLLAVLWFDLMFDVQVLPFPDASVPLPESVLSSIASYYRRATTEAYPMNRVIAAVMLTAIAGSLWQVAHARRRVLAVATVLLVAAPVALAALRVVPNAVRLGSRADTVERQSALARSICNDHLMCLAAILGFTAIQLAGRVERDRARSTSLRQVD